MIECGLEALISWGMTVWLLAFSFLWLWSENALGSLCAFTHMKAFIYRCPICTGYYSTIRQNEYSRCPFCGSVNKKPPFFSL